MPTSGRLTLGNIKLNPGSNSKFAFEGVALIASIYRSGKPWLFAAFNMEFLYCVEGMRPA